MSESFNPYVMLYDNTKDTRGKRITLSEALDSIRNGKYKSLIDPIRAEPDKDKRTVMKQKTLPAFIFQGVFSYRKKEDVLKASKIALMDYDQNEPEKLKSILKDNQHVLFYFDSPSTGHLKIGIHIPLVTSDEEYKKYYFALLEDFKNFGFSQDMSTLDICRLCYVSYDPNLYVNLDAVEYKKMGEKPTKDSRKTEVKQISANKAPNRNNDPFTPEELAIARKVMEYVAPKKTPSYCPSIEIIGCNYLIPSGATCTRHTHWDRNVYAYSRDNKRPDVLQKWSSTQGREPGSYNGDDDVPFTCGSIFAYLYDESIKSNQIVNQIKSLCRGCPYSKTRETPFHVVGQLMADGVEPPKYILDTLLPERGMVILAGAPGSCKSYITQQIALSLVSGRDFGGFAVKKENLKGLWLDEEQSKSVTTFRFQTLKKGMSLSDQYPYNLFSTHFAGIQFSPENDQLAYLMREIKPDFVVIDSFSRCYVGEENSSTDMKLVFNYVRPYFDQSCFIFLHHLNKTRFSKFGQPMDALRGSGDFAAQADAIFIIQKHGQVLNLNCVKHRHTDILQDKQMVFEMSCAENSVCFNRKIEWEKSQVARLSDDFDLFLKKANGQQFKRSECMDYLLPLGYSEASIKRHFQSMVNGGDLFNPKKGYYQATSTPIGVDEVVIDEE